MTTKIMIVIITYTTNISRKVKSGEIIHTTQVCLLQLYCDMVPDAQTVPNTEKLQPWLMSDRNRRIEAFRLCHSIQTSFGSLDRLSLQPCLRSRKVYQGGRDEGHLQTITVRRPWKMVSCSYEPPHILCTGGSLYNGNIFRNYKTTILINNKYIFISFHNKTQQVLQNTFYWQLVLPHKEPLSGVLRYVL